jgi:hypothetical protein
MRKIANNCYTSLPEALEGQPIDSGNQHIEASHNNSNIDDEEAIFSNDTSERKIMLLQEPPQAHRPIS